MGGSEIWLKEGEQMTVDELLKALIVALSLIHISKIIARIFDSLREDIFSRFDIQTVCPTNITVSSVYAMLTNRRCV